MLLWKRKNQKLVKMKRNLFTLFFICITLIGSNAQCIPNPDVSFGTSCSNAPIVCTEGYSLTEFCGSTEYNPFPNPTWDQPISNQDFCGSIDNPRWMGFVAATSNLDLYILVENCLGTPTGIGMQAMVYQGCGQPWIQAANCIDQIYPNSSIYYSLNNLIIGQTYYLVLDGWSGDVCDFYVEIVGGALAESGGLVADAGNDVSFNCNSGSALLDGSNSIPGSNTTFSWYEANGNLLGLGPTFQVNETGIYILELTEFGLCPVRDTVQVFNSGVLQLELGDPIYLDCNLSAKMIEGENVPDDPFYSYQWTTVDGNIVAGENTMNPIVDSGGEYVLTIFDNLNPCSFSDEITVYEFEDVIEFDSIFYKKCYHGDSFVLDASTINVTPSDVVYSWTTNDGIITNYSHLLNPTISGEGTYNITITDTLIGCTLVDSVLVQDTLIQNIPQVDFLGDSTLNCINSEVQLTGVNSTLFNNVTFKWIKGAGSGIVISNDTTATVYHPGIYTLRLKQIGSTCRNDFYIEIFEDTTEPDFVFSNSMVELNCNNDFMETVIPIFQDTFNASYQWSGPNNFTPTDSIAIISGDIEGTVELMVTNEDNGCTFSSSFEVINNGFDMEVSAIDATCDMQDGSASVTTTLSNSSIAWSNGGQGNTITGLGQGYHSVTVTDLDNNCGKHQNFFVDEDLSCKVVISGYVVNDPNILCTYDSTMEGLELIMIKLEPLGIYTFTDSTGYFEFVVDDGMYLVQFIGSDFVDLQCPIQGAYIVELNTNGTSSDDNHFFVKRKEQDLCLTKFSGNAAVGRRQFNCVQVCNYGVTTEDAVVTFVHDSIFSEVTPLPNIIPISGNSYNYTYDESLQTFTWMENNLSPGQCRKIMFYMETPITAQIGDTVHAEAKVTLPIYDVNPGNNCLSWNAPVTASFDPNDKRNFVGETPWGGNIYEDDTTMEYAIRFQNTGTDTAYTVVIRDTLDDIHLDVTSLRAFNSSHDMQVQFEGTNVLIFNFENIMLVDSMTNEEASKGWVTFNIDLYPDLPIGTEIKNGSAIYFDYNDPIITNDVVNIIDAHFLEIAGVILNDDMDEVENVNVMLSGGASETIITDGTGEFSFRDLVKNEDYEVHFEKDIYPLNGVTTYDIVNIHWHILGTEFLDSPYKILAADVNNSGTITALDIIQIRNLILLNIQEFPFSPSWKFVDGDFIFTNPQQPFAANVPTSFSFQNLINNKNLNVVGIKMGDVNITSDPNSLLSVDTRNKEGYLSFSIENQEVTAGEEIMIGFAAKDFHKMLTYQFTLDFENKLKYTGIENGILPEMTEDNLGLRFLEKGQLTVAWTSFEAKNVEDGEPLFFLKFNALENGLLSEMLHINSDKTEALAYDEEEQILDVNLLFENIDKPTQINIFPNPARENIYLSFRLEKEENIGIEIYNAFGKLEKRIFQNKNFDKGFFQENIKVKNFSKGTYFVKIKIGEKVMVKKIVIL